MVESSFNKWFQYFMAYCMISHVGTALPEVMGNDNFIVSMLLISTYIILKKKTVFNQGGYLIFIGFLFISLMLVAFSSGLTVASSLSVISTFLVSYATFKLNPDKFIPRLLYIIFVLAVVSIVLFIIQYKFSVYVFSPLFPYLHYLRGTFDMPIYGGFVYRFVTFHAERNCGAFPEPGKYQCVLSFALYFTLFRRKFFDNEKYRYWSAVVYSVALVSTMSTSGYLSLFIIALCYFFKEKNKEDKKMRTVFLYLVILGAFFFLFTSLGAEFWRVSVLSKIDSQTGEITGSGTARTGTIEDVIHLISTDLSYLWGIGYDNMHQLGVDGCAGLFGLLLAIGVLPYSIIMFFGISKCLRYSSSVVDALVCILILVNMGLGQPHIMNPLMFTLLLYPYFEKSIYRKAYITRQ